MVHNLLTIVWSIEEFFQIFRIFVLIFLIDFLIKDFVHFLRIFVSIFSMDVDVIDSRTDFHRIFCSLCTYFTYRFFELRFLTLLFRTNLRSVLDRKSRDFHLIDPKINLTFQNVFYNSIKLTLVQGHFIFQSAAF